MRLFKYFQKCCNLLCQSINISIELRSFQKSFSILLQVSLRFDWLVLRNSAHICFHLLLLYTLFEQLWNSKIVSNVLVFGYNIWTAPTEHQHCTSLKPLVPCHCATQLTSVMQNTKRLSILRYIYKPKRSIVGYEW